MSGDVRGLEEARNRELRRRDWRFLHPGLPLQHLERVPRNVEELTAGSGSPQPGGVYLEWRRAGLGGASALREKLARVGVRDVEIYWPWPGLRQPWFWLPLGSKAAAAYVAGTRLQPRSWIRRVIDPALRALWSRAAAAERLWPLCAVGRIEGVARNESLRDRIDREWEAWGIGDRPLRHAWMLLTRGGRTINKVVGLVFAEPDPTPRIAVKLARVPEAEPALHREARVLAVVHGRAPGGLRGAPRVLFCDDRSGVLALAETALPGRPLFSLLQPSRYREIAMLAVEWLADLAGPLAPGRAGAAAGVVHEALRRFADSFGAVITPAELRQTEQLLEPLAGLPSVLEHRDFSPWNVHLAPNGDIVVHDWESAEPVGLPLTDLVYFLTYLGFFRARASAPDHCAAVYRTGRSRGSATGAVHAEALARYASRIGLDPTHVRGLHALTWLIHSRSEYHRLVADLGGPPAPNALGRSLFLALWREELRR
jgi:hypothetical protein